jgi:uridine phosphorylase
MPAIEAPESVIFCLQNGLPQRRRVRKRHPYTKAGKLTGDLLLLKNTDSRVAVMTNLGIGAPMLASLADELIAWGVKQLVIVAWAGALQPDLDPGDIIICERAIRDEGTSHHYLPASKYAHADRGMAQQISDWLDKANLPHRPGATWTTDAPYRETEAEVRQYQAEGVLTVEMEAAALFALGEVHHVATGAVFVIGDRLARLHWEAPEDINTVERVLEEVYSAIIAMLKNS